MDNYPHVMLTSQRSNARTPNIAPRICPECGRPYSRGALTRHRAQIHGVNQQLIPCLDCTKVFTRNDALMDHRRNVHPGVLTQEEALEILKTQRNTKHVLVTGIIDATRSINEVITTCLQKGLTPADCSELVLKPIPSAVELMTMKIDELSVERVNIGFTLQTWEVFGGYVMSHF